jgi:thioesterase domain-containing protein
VQAPHASVDDMAAEYVAELRRQQPRGPYFLGALCAGAYVAAEMARALADAGEVVLPLLLLDPPERLAGGYAQLTEERFIRKMKERRAMGRSAGHADDPESMGALVRTALAFEQAVARHQPRRYDGAVYMLSSRQRMRDADPAEWRKIFTGKLKRFEVGTTHGEALDPRNPLFASYLLRCVALIREAARSAQAHRDNAAALPARRHPA